MIRNMKIDNELELNYLEAIGKQWAKRSDKNNDAVNKRNHFVHKHFQLNEMVINQISELNTKMRSEEERIFPLYRKLIQESEKLIRKKTIDDFNLEVVISTFSDKHYINLNPELVGNAIIETNCDFMRHQEGETYTEEDWKDAGVPEGLRNFKHCYSFHHLYDHTDLTWYDLHHIEAIWFEIKIDYQFFIEI